MGLFIFHDWFDFMVFLILETLVVIGSYSLFFTKDPSFSIMSTFSRLMLALLVATFTFSLFEKVRKEQFVIGFTNAKTKKILL